ncbi:type II toxin-antitoxin system RelE/ParE family toxin [Luteimonas suaedae]|uniref:type II toxin-antitoxin system RelE/ParE family toxin n=1 Tax=Luteimonas suaedae TaxID=2605430 RepID=UPI0011EFAEAA|nr:type II toxin-antitoxin system RelE/ParE family toxin [Luteimonas suaedae]
MRVHWTPQAEQDRDEIWNHIAADNPSAAARMDLLFSEAAAKLAEFPMLGHAGRILGTRELIPHESYRLVYEIVIDENAVWVLALVHTARQWPPVMD